MFFGFGVSAGAHGKKISQPQVGLEIANTEPLWYNKHPTPTNRSIFPFHPSLSLVRVSVPLRLLKDDHCTAYSCMFPPRDPITMSKRGRLNPLQCLQFVGPCSKNEAQRGPWFLLCWVPCSETVIRAHHSIVPHCWVGFRTFS